MEIFYFVDQKVKYEILYINIIYFIYIIYFYHQSKIFIYLNPQTAFFKYYSIGYCPRSDDIKNDFWKFFILLIKKLNMKFYISILYTLFILSIFDTNQNFVYQTHPLTSLYVYQAKE